MSQFAMEGHEGCRKLRVKIERSMETAMADIPFALDGLSPMEKGLKWLSWLCEKS